MEKRNIVKRLVKELDQIDLSSEENLPLEYYELKELARTRVLLKSSLKVHAIIYLFGNIFISFINLFAVSNVENIYDFWALWSILGWGLFFWGHFLIVSTINFINLERRIFTITAALMTYIAIFLIFINYYSNYVVQATSVWWPWPAIGFLLFIGAYAYIVFENDDTSKMEKRISIEIKKMKDEQEERQDKLEAKQKTQK